MRSLGVRRDICGDESHGGMPMLISGFKKGVT